MVSVMSRLVARIFDIVIGSGIFVTMCRTDTGRRRGMQALLPKSALNSETFHGWGGMGLGPHQVSRKYNLLF